MYVVVVALRLLIPSLSLSSVHVPSQLKLQARRIVPVPVPLSSSGCSLRAVQPHPGRVRYIRDAHCASKPRGSPTPTPTWSSVPAGRDRMWTRTAALARHGTKDQSKSAAALYNIVSAVGRRRVVSRPPGLPSRRTSRRDSSDRRRRVLLTVCTYHLRSRRQWKGELERVLCSPGKPARATSATMLVADELPTSLRQLRLEC